MQADEGAEGDATEVAYLQLSQGSEGDDFKQVRAPAGCWRMALAPLMLRRLL